MTGEDKRGDARGPMGEPDQRQKHRAQQAPAPRTDEPGAAEAVTEIGGPKGPEPTRYGDWERNGRCIDF